jgi:hypothetical protein
MARHFKDRFHAIYYNTKDPLFAACNQENINEQQVLERFDEYKELETTAFSKTGGNRLKRVFQFVSQRPRLKKQLAELAPDVIVTTGDGGAGINRYCNIWAEKNGIPFIVIQPAFISNTAGRADTWKDCIGYLLCNIILRMPLCRKQKLFGNERPCNYLFLWGEFFKNFYKGTEIEKNIYVTGNPAFDEILDKDINERPPVELEVEIPKGSKVITICTQPLDKLIGKELSQQADRFFASAIKNNPDLFFIIKVHPREETKKYVDIFSDLNVNNYTVVKDVGLNEIFTVTDLQVSVSSSASFDAVISGIPVVIVNPEGRIQLFDYFKGQIELTANTPDELNMNLIKGLTDEYIEEFKVKREKYLESRLRALDGNSSKRAIEKIQEIAEKNKK